MNIKILGTGCPKCKALEQVTHQAVAALKIHADIEKVEDIVKIIGYGVMHTPAMVIDEKIALSGRVPSLRETIEVLTKYQQ